MHRYAARLRPWRAELTPASYAEFAIKIRQSRTQASTVPVTRRPLTRRNHPLNVGNNQLTDRTTLRRRIRSRRPRKPQALREHRRITRIIRFHTRNATKRTAPCAHNVPSSLRHSRKLIPAGPGDPRRDALSHPAQGFPPLAMQKVEGSSPFIRFGKPAIAGFLPPARSRGARPELPAERVAVGHDVRRRDARHAGERPRSTWHGIEVCLSQRHRSGGRSDHIGRVGRWAGAGRGSFAVAACQGHRWRLAMLGPGGLLLTGRPRCADGAAMVGSWAARGVRGDRVGALRWARW